MTGKVIDYLKLNPSPAATNQIVSIKGEARWIAAKRPYYNVWPSVVEAFTHVDLDKVRCDDVRLPISELAIRFPVGHELGGKVRTILVTQQELVTSANGKDHPVNGWLLAIQDGRIDPELGFSIPTLNAIRYQPGQTIMDRLRHGRLHPYCDDVIDHEMVDLCTKLCVTLALLRDNPDLIEPSPLEADRQKWDQTHDLKFIEKAARRGKREWDIGRHIEVAPGFRRPHFAIRWMGKGFPKRPVVRPIKGCLVRKQKITEIPTGFLDEEE